MVHKYVYKLLMSNLKINMIVWMIHVFEVVLHGCKYISFIMFFKKCLNVITTSSLKGVKWHVNYILNEVQRLNILK
jgi:hypothetical protein